MGLMKFDQLNTLSTTETTKDDRKKATRKKYRFMIISKTCRSVRKRKKSVSV